MNNIKVNMPLRYVLLFVPLIWLLYYTYTTLQNKQIFINLSDSLPQKIFVVAAEDKIARGDIVSICDFETKYTGDKINFIKQIVGVAGDKVKITNSEIYINDKKFGELKKLTFSGKSLTPIGNLIIPAEHFFVISNHPISFDSRYQEFGLVKINNISGKVIWSL